LNLASGILNPMKQYNQTGLNYASFIYNSRTIDSCRNLRTPVYKIKFNLVNPALNIYNTVLLWIATSTNNLED
jgi:hypothetical protein